MRIIYNRKKYEHISDVIATHCWGDLSKLANRDFAKLVKQIKEGQTSAFLNNLLVAPTESRTRSRASTCKPYKSTMGQKTIRYRAVNLLNLQHNVCNVEKAYRQ